MKSIKEVLMERDGMGEKEADDLIEEAQDQMQAYLECEDIVAAESICADYFGLEPDYLMQLM